MHNDELEPDDMIYISSDAQLSVNMEVDILPADPSRPARFQGRIYLLGIEQIRDAIEAAETTLQRSATPEQRYAAIKHFFDNDAFISLGDLLQIET